MNNKDVYPLPKRVGTYELVSNPNDNSPFLYSVEEWKKHLRHFPKGDIEEVAISYIGHTNQFNLRFRGRGSNLKLYKEELRLIYDHLAPVTATYTSEEAVFTSSSDMIDIYDEFIDWFRTQIS